jgi:hypothetical protein
MILWRLAALTTIVAVLASCSSTSDGSDPASVEASATAHILAIPEPTPEKYRGMIGAKGWQNPYLIIKPAGVALLDPDNHEEVLFKPEELTQALGKLPPSAWPYGRVVAVTEIAVKVAGDDVPIRKNRAIVAGTLESLHVLIRWIPSA